MKKNWKIVLLTSGIGLFCFILTQISDLILWGITFSSFNFLMGSSYTITQILLIYLFVPVILILSGLILARRLHCSWKQSIVIGVISFLVMAALEVNQSNYAPFDLQETLAYQSIAILSVIASVILSHRIGLQGKIVVILISLLLIISAFLTKGHILIALLPWVILPFIAETFYMSKLIHDNSQ